MNIHILRIIIPDLLCSIASKSSYIAIAWWILTTENSVIEFALLVSIATFTEAILIPLLAPLNDKHGAIKAYKYSVWVCILSTSLVAFGYFTVSDSFLPIALIGLLVIIVASSIRDSGVKGVINDTIKPAYVQQALRVQLSLNSIVGMIAPVIGAFSAFIGGVVSAVLVSFTSYLLAMLIIKLFWNSGLVIKNNTNENSANRYLSELKQGLKAVYAIKTEFYLGILAALLNFIIVPFFAIMLPYYVSQSDHLTIMDLGYLDAFFALGLIIGASKGVPVITKLFGKQTCILLGYGGSAVSLFIFAFQEQNISIMFAAMLLAGFSLPLENIHLIAMRIVATPSNYVSRVSGVVSGLCLIAIPLGSAILGLMLNYFSFHGLVFSFGVVFLFSMCAFPFIPNIQKLLSYKNDNDLEDLYLKIYPKAFS